MQPTVIVIIVTYNGAKWIDKCFGSLRHSSIPLKTLAIDNCSSDNTPNIIRERFPEVEVIETGQNLGFGKANNIGLKRVLDENADYAFLLNQDAWVEKDTVEKLVEAHNKYTGYALVCPLQLNGAGNSIDDLFFRYTIALTQPLVADSIIHKTQEIYETPFANGACWLMPLSTINSIGGFDPLFTHYGEDNDYINRMHRHKMKVGLCPLVKVYHDRENRGSAVSEESVINKIFMKTIVILKKNGAPRSKLFYFFEMIRLRAHYLLFRKKNSYYEYKALRKLLNIYDEVRLRYSHEQKKEALYLK